MLFESLNNKSRVNENERLRLHNQMQMALVRKFFGFKPSNEQIMKWIEEYSAAFRRLVQERPELLDEFQQEQDAALAKAEAALYQLAGQPR